MSSYARSIFIYGWNRSSTKNAKNGTEQDDHSSTQNETEQEGMEQERND